jgi:arsenite methyltransferase
MITEQLAVDPVVLREEVKSKYRDVAINPSGEYHFHTGKPLARRLGYDSRLVDSMPDSAVESFAGVANPFSLRSLEPGENVVDAGSGGGFDCFVAAHQVGPQGRVVGVDMLAEMLAKSRETAEFMGVNNVEFREGLLEEIPVEDGWADVVISNGVINLCADKKRVFSELWRILRPGGILQFGDIANGKPVPESAIRNIDLWTAWIAGGLPCEGWRAMLADTGFVGIQITQPYDTFGEARGEKKARLFDVYGYTFLARKLG